MGCAAAEETRKYTPTFIDLWEPVDIKFGATAYGAGAKAPRPDIFHLSFWCSLITCKAVLPGNRGGRHVEGSSSLTFQWLGDQPGSRGCCPGGET